MKLKTFAVLTMLATCGLMGCASTITQTTGQTELADEMYDADVHIAGSALAAVDAPTNIVGGTWVSPQTEFPYYLTSIVDPYNYPQLLWRAFYTVWTLPFNPAYHLTEETTEEWNRHVQPIGETIAYDFTPAPHGGGDFHGYFGSRFASTKAHVNNIGHTIKYHFFNTNSLFPPYDRWYPDQIQQDKTTIHRSFDLHAFRYDWDDPYID